jgi:predicted nucleotidyltransferase
MKIVAILAEKAAMAGVPFLVIGGNAVIVYGYPRQTADVDLLVREADREVWDGLIRALGYVAHHIQPAFQMYNPVAGNLPPVDLMLVDGGTFAKLDADAREVAFSGVRARIPSLRHLIALKLHALRSGQANRRERDFLDVITLVQLNDVDLASREYVEILDRYATAAIRAELRFRLAGPESPNP